MFVIGFTLFGFNGVLAVAAIAGAALAGAYLLRKDTAVEERRRHAIDIASELKNQGLEHIPDVLVDYAVGDYSGAMSRIKSWYGFLRSDEDRRAFFAAFRRKQLEIAMRDPASRAVVLETVDNWKATEKVKQDEQFARMQAERAAEKPIA